MRNPCQSHNSLISSRPSWRQWAGFGLMQGLWFGLGLCGLECRKEPFLLTHIPFICVTHACPVCASERGVNLSRCLLLLFWYLLNLLRQTSVETGTGSLFCFDNTWTLLVSIFSLSELRPFYLFIIKSYHAPAPLCLIHLRLSFNHCHAAPVFWSPN